MLPTLGLRTWGGYVRDRVLGPVSFLPGHQKAREKLSLRLKKKKKKAVMEIFRVLKEFFCSSN